ncbi:hypothetical protein EG68_07956 [Paragonimus skrjabini miyazakii]|uniref:Uncharacterized protein n=1 Tax=Paragonimus skrjabini miyazakii TaxID=59628 RepID=A0A8S9YR90_9TREM|nr:hypothetical protein EG68_07956 [Paragonimus skrjabini miyazakii]
MTNQSTKLWGRTQYKSGSKSRVRVNHAICRFCPLIRRPIIPIRVESLLTSSTCYEKVVSISTYLTPMKSQKTAIRPTIVGVPNAALIRVGVTLLSQPYCHWILTLDGPPKQRQSPCTSLIGGASPKEPTRTHHSTLIGRPGSDGMIVGGGMFSLSQSDCSRAVEHPYSIWSAFFSRCFLISLVT